MEIGICCFVLPAVAETITLYVPAFMLSVALNLSIPLLDPGASVVLGAKAADIPLGSPERENSTGALKPLLRSMLKVISMFDPPEILTALEEGVT